MHQAQPKEGHKIWLTQEADAKSWSSLKHVQPKEGRKELAPREIKFRYRLGSIPQSERELSFSTLIQLKIWAASRSTEEIK